MSHIHLIKQLSFLSKGLSLEITFKDTSGFLNKMDNNIKQAFLPYNVHRNAYCYTMKAKDCSKSCSGMMHKIEKTCMQARKIFIGTCYAGVLEYIVPVFSNNKDLLGFFTVGSFRHAGKLGDYMVKRSWLKNSISFEAHLYNYSQLPSEMPYSLPILENAFSFIIDYIAYEYEQAKTRTPTGIPMQYLMTEDGMLSKVIDVILLNYQEDLSVTVISKMCGCSESYINHTFKTKTGVSISYFKNWIKINKAQELLSDPNISISEVAIRVGIPDMNYFTKVFKTIQSQTPSDYRKSLKIRDETYTLNTLFK